MRQAKIQKLEDFFDNDPLGQRIAQHLAKGKELVGESKYFSCNYWQFTFIIHYSQKSHSQGAKEIPEWTEQRRIS